MVREEQLVDDTCVLLFQVCSCDFEWCEEGFESVPTEELWMALAPLFNGGKFDGNYECCSTVSPR